MLKFHRVVVVVVRLSGVEAIRAIFRLHSGELAAVDFESLSQRMVAEALEATIKTSTF